MKKLKKSFISLILFLMYSNKIYATTTGTYKVAESGITFGKVMLFALGIGLIVFILFFGYIMDKKETTKKKRDDFVRKQVEENSEDNNLENDKVDYKNEAINLKNNLDKNTSDIDIIDDSLNNINIKDDFKSQETQVINTNRYNNIDEDDEDDEDITFDDLLKAAEAADDIELEDIENEVKKANIKRYTRNKNAIGNRNKSKIIRKKPIVFYAKKDENEIIVEAKKELENEKVSNDSMEILDDNDSIVETDANIELEEDIDKLDKDDAKIEEEKLEKIKESEESKEAEEPLKRKRGRPKGSKNKPKVPAKRGRPKGSKNKPKNGTNKKRGRPSKKDLEKRRKAEAAAAAAAEKNV